MKFSLKFVSKGPITNQSALVWVNGLALNKQQAIIWFCVYQIDLMQYGR